jgi:hypothetical protein
MREYAFLDENNIVISIGYMDIFNPPTDFEFTGAILITNDIPLIGQVWDGELNQFV